MMKVELTTLKDCESPEIEKLLETLLERKEEAVASGNGELANQCWRETEALKLNILYINAFSKIKNEKYRDAWCELERCEINCNFLEENSSQEFLVKTRVCFIKEKIEVLQSLYPYCIFASPGFTVSYYKCSICDHKIRPRSRCEHKKGKIYNGELCVHIAGDMEFKEISLVTKPVQKYSVVHDDKTLDFSLLIYLFDIVENPFEDWDVNWTTMKFPIDRFSSLEKGGECPCKSGAIFKDCCLEKDEVEIPHVDFTFSKPIPDSKEKIKFPY